MGQKNFFRHMLLSMFFLCLVILWAYAVFCTNKEYKDTNLLTFVKEGQSAEIQGLHIEVTDSRIYEIAAFWDEFQQYNLTETIASSMNIGSADLGIPKVLFTIFSVSNKTDAAVDFNQSDIFFYGFRNGAWYNGPDISSFTMSELYSGKEGILEAGESAELILWTVIYPGKVPKDKWNHIAEESFCYVVQYSDGEKHHVYECQLGDIDEIAATKTQQAQLAAAIEELNSLPENETAGNPSAGPEIPEDTTKHITSTGEEFFINGIGYKVISAVATDDLSLVPEYLENMENWSTAQLPAIEDFYEIDGLAYVFIQYEITSYRDNEFCIQEYEKDMLDLFRIPSDPSGWELPVADSWRYFDQSQHKGSDPENAKIFNKYVMQPGEKLETTVGFVISECLDPEKHTPFMDARDHFYLCAVQREDGFMGTYADQSVPIYDLDKIEFRLKDNAEQGGTSQ